MNNQAIWVIGYRAASPEAVASILNADLVLVRGNLAARWLEGLGRHSFQLVSPSDEESASEALAQIGAAITADQFVVYVTMTDPLAADHLVRLIVQKYPEQLLHWLAGDDLGVNAYIAKNASISKGTAVVDGRELEGRFHLPFSPVQTAVIYYPGEGKGLAELSALVKAVYPATHKLNVLFEKANGRIEWNEADLDKLSQVTTPVAAILIPPRSSDSSLEEFQELIAHLRAPNGCPWDKKQTHDSLRTYLLEETYEALSALDAKDMDGLSEELGDLVLQIALHAQIGVEAAEFNFADVLEGINRKIVYRHPHVFGDATVDGEKGVLQTWEKLKQKERAENGQDKPKGLLDGIPITYPALSQAQSIQDRAARVGFDWREIGPVMDKVHEEYEEVMSAPNEQERAKELGDLLFAVVNLVRWYKVDAESALRETNLKFRRRFAYIEKRSVELGKPMQDMSLEEMDGYWNEAKGLEKRD
ncbi:MAG: nucleoside triphosphate pyrophosphohydrolase [Anaerolineaceae bacterium]|nr:nucleoside triphosphate pyrophosphohydrolase [Anaerolineaceae bacterium]